MEEAKRRLLLQLGRLGLPIVGWDLAPGGLGFDLISSLTDGHAVMIGHANGIITIDLAESLDDRREAMRVRLGEPYRTILGHLRHEVGHYYQNVLLTDDADEVAVAFLQRPIGLHGILEPADPDDR